MTRRVIARLAAAGLFTASAAWCTAAPAHAGQATLTLKAPARVAVNDDPVTFSGQLRRSDSTPLTNVVLGLEIGTVDAEGDEMPIGTLPATWKVSYQEGSGEFQDGSVWTYRGDAANSGSSPWHTVEVLGGIRHTFTDTSLDLHFRITTAHGVEQGTKLRLRLRLYPTADGFNPTPSGPDDATSGTALVPIESYHLDVTLDRRPVRGQPVVLNVRYVNPSKVPVHAGINSVGIYNAAGDTDHGVPRPKLGDLTLDYLNPATHRWTPLPLTAAPTLGWGGGAVPPGGFTAPAHGQSAPVSFRLTPQTAFGYDPLVGFSSDLNDNWMDEAHGSVTVNYEPPAPPAAAAGGANQLPVTGGTPVTLALGAGLLLAAGSGLLLAARRRQGR